MPKVHVKCTNCHEEILQENPTVCPYCGSKVFISDEEIRGQEIEEIKQLERVGRFEEAAQRYEKLEMWDEAGEARRMAKTNYVVSANLNIGKIGAISMECLTVVRPNLLLQSRMKLHANTAEKTM